MEEEIEKILSKIEHKDIRTFNEIEENLEIGVNKAYQKFMVFEKNHQNKLNSLAKLKENKYEYVTQKKAVPGDYVRFLDKTYFFDLTLHKGGFIVKKKDHLTQIKCGFRRLKWVSNKEFFRKLSNQDMVKITLIETINKNLN